MNCKKSFFILFDGTISSCCASPVPFGNILHSDLKNIRHEKIFKDFYSYLATDPSCKECAKYWKNKCLYF